MDDSVTGHLIQPLSSVADIRTFVLAGDVGKKGAEKRAAREANAQDAPQP